jgi:hypothetical protein
LKIAKSLGVMFFYLYSSLRGFGARALAHRHLKRTQRAISIEQELRSIDDVDELYRRIKTKYADLIHIRQDEKYVAWRILGNPNVKYATFFAYKDKILKAYCYVALGQNKEACLSDLTFEDYEVGNLLLMTVLDFIRKREISNVNFIGNIRNPMMNTVISLLSKNGFVKRDSIPFVFKNISYQDEGYLHDISNWYINGLWTEGYTF